MFFFEFVEPYYALIKAESYTEAVTHYIENVAGDKEDFDQLFDKCKLVPEYYASAKISRSRGENGELLDFKEVLKIIESNKTEVLLIDGSLL